MTTGCANYELRRDALVPTPWTGFARNGGDQTVGGSITHLVDGNVDRGERRIEVLRQRDIVESDHTDVGRDALAGLARWKERHPEAAAHLAPADVLVDAMRGRFHTWTRIRVNLEHVPVEQRPPQEALDPDDVRNEWGGEGAELAERRQRGEAGKTKRTRKTPR